MMKSTILGISLVAVMTSAQLISEAEAYHSAVVNIHNCVELQGMQSDLAGTYELVNDIDCSGVDFHPIGGGPESPFVGTLNGNGYTISNLSISKENDDYIGLFRATFEDALVQNLTLENVDVLGRTTVGALIGLSDGNSLISNIRIQGKVSSSGELGFVGGLVGTHHAGRIIDSSAAAEVTSMGVAGGLVGVSFAEISKSHSAGDVKQIGQSWGNLGGLVGDSIGGSITDSYSLVNVHGNENNYAGGLVGQLSEGEITNCYAQGSVNANTAGGLVGYSSESTINNSYSTGKVWGRYISGGLIGDSFFHIVTNSYWDSETSGQTTSAGGSGRTTAEMYQKQTYQDWDFDTIWEIEEGVTYPILRSDILQPQKLKLFIRAYSENK